MVSAAYLRLLIFLPEIFSPACESSSLAFHMIYSAYKLNKQGDNTQPSHSPFPIVNQYIVPCRVLTVISWPAYRFLRRQVRWLDSPISKNFPLFIVIHTVNGFSVVNEAVDVFQEFPCFLYDSTNVGNLISFSHNSTQSTWHISRIRWDNLTRLTRRDGHPMSFDTPDPAQISWRLKSSNTLAHL